MSDRPQTTLGNEPTAVELQNHILDGTDVRDFLDHLAAHAARALAVGGTDVHCGVTLLRQDRAGSAGSSSNEARVMDEIQYGFVQGPCLSAARTQQVFHVADVAAEERWPDYMAAVRPAGVRSILAVPFSLEGEAMGSLNLYAEAPQMFDGDAVDAATWYADHASAALRLALRIGGLQETKEGLRAAMEARTTVDVALGILMARNRCTQDEALATLNREGSERHLKPQQAAARIIDSAAPGRVTTHFDE